MNKKNLLFLCTGNSCRSQMAEAYGKIFLSNRYNIYSAGIEKHGLNPYMLKVMEEDGIDMKNHYSKTLYELDSIHFDIVVTVCDNASETCPLYLKEATKIHKSFQDPAKFLGSEEEKIHFFRKVRDEIKAFIRDELTILNL
ncbi:MAG: arsenate reductase ArsC [Calditerrivibrio sp.]|nr:arsenate reductase ArsC [Calditerrivibrio sp.]